MVSERRARPPAIRVAIVDDFKLVIEGLAAHLSNPRFRISVVIQASSWGELISHPEFPPDVTVLDLNLNDGINPTTRIKALRAAGSEVVVISRHAGPASIARAMEAGALGYVSKTESIAELVTAITTTALGRRHLTEPLAAALERISTPSNPGLGQREHHAIALYATGRSIKDVAAAMQTTDETVKSYIKRARRKYRDAGIELGTRVLLRNHGIREGWLDPD